MNLAEKKVLFVAAVNSIVDHDDAPLAAVEDAVTEMQAYITQRLQAARQRREAPTA